MNLDKVTLHTIEKESVMKIINQPMDGGYFEVCLLKRFGDELEFVKAMKLSGPTDHLVGPPRPIIRIAQFLPDGSIFCWYAAHYYD